MEFGYFGRNSPAACFTRAFGDPFSKSQYDWLSGGIINNYWEYTWHSYGGFPLLGTQTWDDIIIASTISCILALSNRDEGSITGGCTRSLSVPLGCINLNASFSPSTRNHDMIDDSKGGIGPVRPALCLGEVGLCDVSWLLTLDLKRRIPSVRTLARCVKPRPWFSAVNLNPSPTHRVVHTTYYIRIFIVN